jgi:hypothetical protein
MLVVLMLLIQVVIIAAARPRPVHYMDVTYKNVTYKADFGDQTEEERLPHYWKLHKCRDGGEVYSAAYLIHKEHLLYQFTDYNLTWVNCEMASFIMMNGRATPSRNVNGSLVQSLDVLDFSVLHLSAYERLQRRWSKSIGADNMKTGNIDPIHTAVARLKELALAEAARRKQPGYQYEHPGLNRTVVIMPFLGSDMGAGHSKLGNRFVYLQACFWSNYLKFPHVTVAVKGRKDYDWARESSGLPFWDVMLIEGLPKSASLPVATVQQTKARIHDGRWDFDYIYFTESDQILMMRPLDEIYRHLEMYKRRLLVPHRLMPYPEPVLSMFHKRNVNAKMASQAVKGYGPEDWEKMNCCLRRQNCWDRNEWIKVSNSTVPVVSVHGIITPLGNSNFHAETYRYCQLRAEGGQNICP